MAFRAAVGLLARQAVPGPAAALLPLGTSRVGRGVQVMVWRAFGRSRRGRLPPPSRITRPAVGTEKGKDEEDAIVFKEEDDEDMQSFMEEFDEVMTEEERKRAGAGGPVAEYDMETVEMPDGSFSFQPRVKKEAGEQPRQKPTAREFLKSRRKEGDAMSEDEWFEFLRRIGEPSSDDAQRREIVADEQEDSGKRKRVLAGRKPGGRYKFVDRIRVVAYGGQGGKGCISFESVKQGVKRPSGGHGGQGGHVIFVADPVVQGLGMDRHHFHGKDGENGDSANQRGARGAPTLVRVPCGTVVKEVRSGASGEYELVEVCDLDEPMSFYVAATGGKPGLGNSIHAGKNKSGSGHHFRSPGHQGEQRYYELELKTIADVGLVGYPNVGKSTLLGSLSRARPKVADYAFTTLHPTVGKVEYSDAATVTVADLPGLIDGAHLNRGLGHEFLRHIERTKVLLYVLDGAVKSSSGPEERESGDFREPPPVALENLRRELDLYCPGLTGRPSIVFINKSDLVEGSEEAEQVLRSVRALVGEETPLFMGSAREGLDLDGLAVNLRLIVEAAKEAAGKEDEGLALSSMRVQQA